MRKRLIKLLKQAEKQQSLNAVCGDIDSLIDSPRGAEFIADYLIENGVVVPTSKVGEKVYIHQFDNKMKKVVVECEIIEHNEAEELFKVELTDGRILTLLFQFIGKTIFLTREEAEAKLEGGATE